MFTSIVTAIIAFLQAIPIIAKYFPAKTEAEFEADIEKRVVADIEKGKADGRPAGPI